jgi:hypothetical protein
MHPKIMKDVITPDKDTIEYLGKDNLPNDLSIQRTKETLELLEVEPAAVRCSGIGGTAIIFMNDDDQGHIEWDNDGEVDFMNIDKFLDQSTVEKIKGLENV